MIIELILSIYFERFENDSIKIDFFCFFVGDGSVKIDFFCFEITRQQKQKQLNQQFDERT